MSNKKILRLYFVVSAILLLTACNKLEIDNPNGVTFNNFWQSEADALVGLAGVFDAYQYNELAGKNYRQFDLFTDNAYPNNLPDWLEIGTSNHSSSNAVISDFWANYYNVISRANTVIFQVEAMPESAIGSAARKRIIAEASFLRAYAYLDLISLYGDVPFYTEPVDPLGEGKGKTPKTDIEAYMINDLKTNMIPHLPETLTPAEQGRISKWAATALLGKYYLFQQDWANAATAFKQIIDSKTYSLYPNYSTLFTLEGEYSSESLFEIGFIEGGTDAGENFSAQVDTNLAPIIPNSAWRPSDDLANSYQAIDGLPISGNNKSPLYDNKKPYENRDPRLRATLYTNADVGADGKKYWNFNNGNNKHAVRKYSWYTSVQYRNNQGPQNYYMIRYADVLLMYAEAQNELSGPDQSIYDAVIAVRKRAGILPGNQNNYGLNLSMNKNQMRNAIRNERRWEFALEHQRYFDLKRWGIIESVITNLNPNQRNFVFTAPRDLLWPYPQNEIDNNPILKQEGQNPNW